MRVLVTGAAGMLGRATVRRLQAGGHHVLAWDRTEVDLTERAATHAAIAAQPLDTVVHCAAYTAVDAAETDPQAAFAINETAVAHVAQAADAQGAHLVVLSTDYVFDGTKPTPYTEQDEPNPVSVYGASKLAGERAAWAHCARVTVVRTSWLCGAQGANVLRTALRLLDEPGELCFVDDQIGHPTFTADLAGALRDIVEEGRNGLYHVTNQGVTSWYGFVCEIARAAGHDPQRVRAIATADLRPARPARRPANSVLDNAALRAQGRPLLPHFTDALARTLAEIGRRPGP